MLTDSKEESAGKKKSAQNKQKIFLKKYLCFLQNIYYLQIIYHFFFFYMEKNSFYRENINENAKQYILFQKYIFTQNMFVLQTKYKSFLNMYSF